MKVLVACEESQTVCKAFRERGHEAYSCDIQDCSGGHPEWHIKGDALKLINGRCSFVTEGGQKVNVDGPWDLLIAHPPCTYLSLVTTRHLSLRVTSPEIVVARMWKLAGAAVFFMQMMLADCPRIAVENPLGFMSKLYRKPDFTVHPYQFADGPGDVENYEKKRTCFWVKNLPVLLPMRTVEPPDPKGWTKSGKPKYFEECATGSRSKVRSKTFPGIAKAMAEQWG